MVGWRMEDGGFDGVYWLRCWGGILVAVIGMEELD